MKIVLKDYIQDKGEFTVCAVNKKKEMLCVVIQEGTGDNLLDEDLEEGYVDYLNYYCFPVSDHMICEGDGGMIMFKDYYADKSLEDIISVTLQDINTEDFPMVICLSNEADLEFFESNVGKSLEEIAKPVTETSTHNTDPVRLLETCELAVETLFDDRGLREF